MSRKRRSAAATAPSATPDPAADPTSDTPAATSAAPAAASDAPAEAVTSEAPAAASDAAAAPGETAAVPSEPSTANVEPAAAPSETPTASAEPAAAASDLSDAANDSDVGSASDVASVAAAPVPRAPVDEPRRLATALARLARRVWPELDADERGEAGAAVAAFVDAPSPARFVAAARALIRARQSRHTEALRAVFGERAFTRAAAQLADIPFVDEALLATLTAQPRDAAAARRLSTLASLLLAHAELAARLRTPDLGPASLRSDRRSGAG